VFGFLPLHPGTDVATKSHRASRRLDRDMAGIDLRVTLQRVFDLILTPATLAFGLSVILFRMLFTPINGRSSCSASFFWNCHSTTAMKRNHTIGHLNLGRSEAPTR